MGCCISGNAKAWCDTTLQYGNIEWNYEYESTDAELLLMKLEMAVTDDTPPCDEVESPQDGD